MSVDHTKNIIEVRNVSFSFNDENVIEDITLNIHQGDYLGIIGPNGSGKTTLLKIMLGLLTPSHGTVELFGQDIRSFKDWSKIGYVPQKVVHFDNTFPATVYEVVAMGRYGKKGLFHWLNSQDHHIIRESLKQVDMLDYKDRIIGDLSGGQQQRVFIARALSTQPEVVFLDEPTVGVDVQNQEAFYALLKKLNHDYNLTLIMVSHDIDVVAAQATELACVKKTLIYDDDPQNFLKSNKLKKLYGEHVNFVVHTH